MLNLRGSYVALVTPFKDGKLDHKKLEELVEFHIANGTDGLVPCGTTGESPTLSHDEHDEAIEIVIKATNKRIPVLAGTGSNSTEEALRLTKHAEKAGADGVLVVTPYYNRPSQAGLLRHYTILSESTSLPIVPYNVPGRTSVNILPDTMAKLAELKNIIGVKEASGNLAQISEVVLKCGPDFIVMSGDDALTLPIMAVGGKGIISVVANIVPREMSDMVKEYEAGHFDKALSLHKKLFPLSQAMMTLETNPSPIKAAMNLLGHNVGPVRPPLAEVTGENLNKLRKFLSDFGFSL